MGFNSAFEGLKWLGREAGGSTSSSARTKNEESHKLAPLARFLAVGNGKFALHCLRCKRRIKIMGTTG